MPGATRVTSMSRCRRLNGALACFDAAGPTLPICSALTLPRWLRLAACLLPGRGPVLRRPRAVNPRASRSSPTLGSQSRSRRGRSGQETMLYNQEYAANKAVTISGPLRWSRTS